MTGYNPTFEELRERAEQAALTFLATRREELPESALLFDEIERMIRAGGKRIRPCFCYWGYRAGGGTDGEAIVTASAALELLHTFALIHDDVMDDTELRRGQPTVHTAHDVSTAILAGDLALVLADDLLLESDFSDERVRAAFSVYSRMRREVIAGQFLDVRSAATNVDERRARRIAVLKSGRYSVMEPLLVGAALAGAPEHLEKTLAAFGEPLGEAFQLTDDLLGIFGSVAATGKPVDSDIREGKRNLLYAKTFALLSGDERALFTDRWGAADLTDDEVGRLRDLVVSSGAKAEVEKLVVELHGEAERVLEGALDPDSQAALRDLARKVIARDR